MMKCSLPWMWNLRLSESIESQTEDDVEKILRFKLFLDYPLILTVP